MQLGRRHGRAATEHALHIVEHLLAHGGRDDQLFQGLAHGFMGGVAIQLGAGLVPVDHPVLVVVALHGNPRGLLEQLAQALLALAQGLFIVLLAADVLDGANQPAVLIGLAAQQQPSRRQVTGLIAPQLDKQRIGALEETLQGPLRRRAVGRVQPAQQLLKAAVRGVGLVEQAQGLG